MPTYAITAPDGHEYEIDTPEGVSEEQALAHFQQNWKPEAPAAGPDFGNVQSTVTQSQPAPPREQGFTGRLAEQPFGIGARSLEGGVEGAKQFALGVGQRVIEGGLLPSFLQRGAEALGAPKSPLMAASERVGEVAAESGQHFSRTAAGQSLEGQGGEMIGRYGTSAALPGGGASLPAKVGVGALQGAATAATQPVAPGETLEGNIGVGTVGGALAAPVAAAGARVLKGASDLVGPRMREVLATLDANGIRVHPTKLLKDGWFKRTLGFFSDLPGAGGAAMTEREAGELTRAASGKFGKQFPELANTMMEGAKTNLGAKYQQIVGDKPIWLDSTSARQMANIVKNAVRNMDDADAGILHKQIDDILGRGQGGGLMKGGEYQGLRQDLALLQKQYAATRPILADSIGKLRDSLDHSAYRALGTIDKTLPGQLKALNREWANYNVVKDVLDQKAGAKGVVTADALASRTKPGAGGATRAPADMRRLGRDAQAAEVGKPLPRAVERASAPQSLTGTAIRAGLSGLGVTVGRAIGSKAGTNYLLRGFGKGANKLADLAQRTAGAAGGAAADKTRRKNRRKDNKR